MGKEHDRIMLINAIRDGNIALALFMLFSVMVALTFHECAHAYAAHKCGDNTAKAFGRLTLNPIKHIDPLGLIAMLIAGFGWAKPVPINTRNFDNPRKHLALVSLAGPGINFALAFVGTLLYRITILVFKLVNTDFYSRSIDGLFIAMNDDAMVAFDIRSFGVQMSSNTPFSVTFLSMLACFFVVFVSLNIGLGVFNLIPLPPLDGSKVLMCILPPKASMRYSQLERYSSFILLGIFILGRIPQFDFIYTPLIWAREAIATVFDKLITLIPFFS